MLILGGCRCGNIAFTLTCEPVPTEILARACTCSFCAKHGGVWAACSSSVVKINVTEPALVSKYTFGTKTAQFHTCSRCGVVPVVTSRIEDRLYAVVGVNALEGVESSLLRQAPANFEGESEEARLARRKRSWIANAEYAESGALTYPPNLQSRFYLFSLK